MADIIPNNLLIIIVMLVIISGLSAIATFFNIGFQTYGPYIVWFVALGLFYFILPKSVGDIFNKHTF